MSIVESTFSAEGGKIPDRPDRLPVGIDKSLMDLDVFADAYAVGVRPALVRLELAFALRQSVH
jgi:hypothetical protein